MKVFMIFPQVIMEVPMELMVTVSTQKPWMFFPDIVPMGHPIFDIINDTNPEVGETSTLCTINKVHYGSFISLIRKVDKPISHTCFIGFLWVS